MQKSPKSRALLAVVTTAAVVVAAYACNANRTPNTSLITGDAASKVYVAPGAYDEAPVDVSLAKETAKHVLSVPVEALLALAEGGYAVEVVNADGSTRLVRVEPGMYADSFVEVTGSGLRDATKVVVPA